MRASGGRFELGPLFRSFGVYFAISLAMAALLGATESALQSGISGQSLVLRAVRLGVLLVEGVGCVAALAVLFRAKELSDAIRLVLKKLGLGKVLR